MGKVLDFFNRNRKKIPIPLPTPVVWEDRFDTGSLDLGKWTPSNWSAPQEGQFRLDNVDLSQGCLRLEVNQAINPTDTTKVLSVGGEIVSTQKFGYGTYEFEVRAGSTADSPGIAGAAVSGSVSGLFNFVNNSETEIDIELLGAAADRVFFTNYHELGVKEGTEDILPFAAALGFHTYKFVWAPAYVAYFVDGKQMAIHSEAVPSTPAHIIINHWGTNSPYWGGLASPGIQRYLYVKSVKFTAA